MIFPADSANMVWLNTLWEIMEGGFESAPRGHKIKELLGYQTVVDMNYPLVTVDNRKMGYRFAAAEAAWILSGDNRVETIKPFSRDIAKFSDDGETFFGAYGPKIESQLNYVVEKLCSDPDSRQAVINIWRENPPESKDIPCSLSVQWMVRKGHLHCFYTMRASDAWLGWVYDVFNFSMLSSLLLLDLRMHSSFKQLQLGSLCLTAGSQHIYERDFEKVEACLTQPQGMHPYPSWEPQLLHTPKGQFLVDSLWNCANKKTGQGALDLLLSKTAILI